VITNQGGIAKGLYSMKDVELYNQKLIDTLKNHNLELLDIFVSPHHDIVCRSLDRKPGSLMIERAIAIYNVDPQKSFMIGDKQSDVQAAEGAGIRGIKVERNSPLTDVVDFLD
jgi:D-glycero-D-manno-heptose 1,7-bisphosphate phosphatase